MSVSRNALKNDVRGPSSQKQAEDTVLLHVSHSNSKSRFADLRFDLHTTIGNVKAKLRSHTGSAADSMRLQLYNDGGSKLCDLAEDHRPLGSYSPLDGYRIHILDLDPTSLSALGWLEDTSLIEKKDENNRHDKFRKFKEKRLAEGPTWTSQKVKNTSLPLISTKLQQALQLEDKDKVDELKAEILLDLHFSTFLFAREQRFSIEKISALVSIVKDIHQQSTEGRFTVAKSWEYAKNLLLTHTVQRPPFSTALFSLVELQTITQYLLHTYYKHYKLYAYAFTSTYILNVDTMKVDLHELAPAVPILRSAETEDEREAHMARLQKELEEIDRKLKESEQIAREAAIAASIEAAYRATIPTEVTQAASDAVVKHLEQMRTDIEEKLLLTEAMILDKLKGLPISRDSSPEKTRKEASPEKGKEGTEKVKEGKREGKEGKEGKKSKSKK